MNPAENFDIPENEPSLRHSDHGYEWDTSMEELLGEWRKICAHYAELHGESQRYYLLLQKLVSLPATILVAIVAATQTSNFSINCNDENNWVSIFSFVLCVLSIVLDVIRMFFGLDRRSEQHNKLAATYQRVCFEIDEQMIFDSSKRINPRSFIRHVKNVMMMAKKVSPEIPATVERKFVDRHVSTIPLTAITRRPIPTTPVSLPVPSRPTNVITNLTTNLTTTPTTNVTNMTTENDTENSTEDVQDEFIRKLREKQEQKKKAMEEYQLQRLGLE